MIHRSHVHQIRGGGKIRAVPRLQSISIQAAIAKLSISTTTIQQHTHISLYQIF
jgi:hypothetical protein